MKCLFSIVFMSVLGGLAHAGSPKGLACWNAYSRSQIQPVLRAQVLKDDKLQQVQVSETAYAAFSVNPSIQTAVLGKKSTETNYLGQREFKLNQGAKLILPLKLDQKSLKNCVIREKSQRKTNGILMLPLKSKGLAGSGSYTYLPMVCQEMI